MKTIGARPDERELDRAMRAAWLNCGSLWDAYTAWADDYDLRYDDAEYWAALDRLREWKEKPCG